ncbi:MAG: hypothetical protein ACR2QB_03255 [Gammaproteobacteria bacterium]
MNVSRTKKTDVNYLLGSLMRICRTSGWLLATIIISLPSASLAENAVTREGALINATSILLSPNSSAGNSLNAIGGTRVRAIGGTRVRADDNSDAQAIGGTRVRSIESDSIRQLGGIRVSEIENALGATSFDRLVSGPINNIDYATSSFNVLNQKIQLPSIPASVKEGTLVTAIGCNDSSIPAIFINDDEQFLAGVSEILFEGYVQRINPEVATFTVNEITVDYTSLLADAPEPPIIEPGDHVIVRGVTF